jgi:hypothetical protein
VKVQNLLLRMQSSHPEVLPRNRLRRLRRYTSGKGAAAPISDTEKIGVPRAQERRVTYASSGENTMHEAHRKAAELHELAAQAHRTAAEHNEKGDRTAADWHLERALEYSDHAYKLAKEAHNKSGEIGSL